MKPSLFRWLALTAALSFGAMLVNTQHLVVLPAPRAALAALNDDHAEHFACLTGTRVFRTVIVWRSTPTAAAFARTGRMPLSGPATSGEGTPGIAAGAGWAVHVDCPEGPWDVGIAHNHPGGQYCYFRFPTTVVPTGDLSALRATRYEISIIVCREKLVWEQQ